MKPRNHQPRIGVLIWINQQYGRSVLDGILSYTQAHGFAEVRLFDLPTSRPPPQSDTLDGMIAIIDQNETAHLRNLPCPVVLVPHLYAPGKWVSVGTDPRLVARLAAEHLLSLQLRNLATVHHMGLHAYHPLADEFQQMAKAAGADFFLSPEPVLDDARAIEWIRHLPTPCGILAQRDAGALFVARWAAAAGLKVPDDIAIVGIGNDTIQCMTHSPTLTSIAIPAVKIGWTAAQLLENLIRGKSAQSAALPPVALMPRQSTTRNPAKDPLVHAAMEYMQTNLHELTNTTAIAAHVGVSRRTLQYHFRSTLNMTIHEQLAALRLQRALSLLSTTEISIKETSTATGFRQQASFTRFIHAHTGLSPKNYRKKHGHRFVVE
jgi:LacI family transcriptional regulator